MEGYSECIQWTTRVELALYSVIACLYPVLLMHHTLCWGLSMQDLCRLTAWLYSWGNGGTERSWSPTWRRYREVAVTCTSGGTGLWMPRRPTPEPLLSVPALAALCIGREHMWEVSLTQGRSYIWTLWNATHQDIDSSCFLAEIWIFSLLLLFSILWFSIMGFRLLLKWEII